MSNWNEHKRQDQGFMLMILLLHSILCDEMDWAQQHTFPCAGHISKPSATTVHGKYLERKRSLWIERKTVICGKALTVACLYTHTANQQGHRL